MEGFVEEQRCALANTRRATGLRSLKEASTYAKGRAKGEAAQLSGVQVSKEGKGGSRAGEAVQAHSS